MNFHARKTSADGRPNRVPIIAQRKAWDCGAACLAMICGAFGLKVTSELCRDRLGHLQGPASVGDLVEVSSVLGLQAQAYVMRDVQSLFTLSTPAVLHTKSNHFVVLTKICYESRSIEVIDPALGRLRGRLATDVDRHVFFSGIFVTFLRHEDLKEIDHSGPLAVWWDRFCSKWILARRRLRTAVAAELKRSLA